jgi:sulfite reductase beta subunit-like hemoprotein
MTFDPQVLRLDGVYQQRDPARFMQRIKLAAGALSSAQALQIADLAEHHAGGRLHLTTRGSIELHDLLATDLAPLQAGLLAVGLTGRGACGGAVRGVACSTTLSPRFRDCQALARRLHRYFTGNPRFEGLPKKFKIGVDGERQSGRHLIQDCGLVFAGRNPDGDPLWEIWCAGGLGREPRTAFLLRERVDETELFAIIEAILAVYRARSAAGRRLKHLVAEIGEAAFRAAIASAHHPLPTPPAASGLGTALGLASDEAPLLVPVFAGELTAVALRQLAQLAAEYAGGVLLITADQDVALVATGEKARTALQQRLLLLNLGEQSLLPQPVCRVCPGSHECKMGLAPTRDVARQLLALYPASVATSFAISGCPNSCSQPQLADIGVVATRLAADEQGQRTPRFDLYRRSDATLGSVIAEQLTLDELLNRLRLSNAS